MQFPERSRGRTGAQIDSGSGVAARAVWHSGLRLREEDEQARGPLVSGWRRASGLGMRSLRVPIRSAGLGRGCAGLGGPRCWAAWLPCRGAACFVFFSL